MKVLKPLGLICFLLSLTYYTNAQVLGTTLAYWDFANGIPAGFENNSSSGISHWEYRGPDTDPDNTVASRGSCGMGSIPIESESWDDGFVIFDSNYWDDDDDVCGDLGTGQDPAPHTAWLITSSINLTGITTAVLTFQQSYKDYQATLRVQVSTNGGSSWTDVITNPNGNSPASEWKTANITALAAGQANVKIRFLWEGTYYWWQVDDIAIYQPNPNDLMVSNPKYTLYNPTDTSLFNDMEYDQYPAVMIPQFKFSATGQNIGGNSQTQVKLLAKVKRLPELTQVFSAQTSPPNALVPGQSLVYSIVSSYTAPNTTNSYIITYEIDQLEVDNTPANNFDTLDFKITPFTYARDEGAMSDVFVPAAIYEDEIQEVGNVFQARAANLKCTTIGVVFGEGTTPGTTVYGKIYNLNRTVVYGTTFSYVVNSADINSEGGSNVTHLKLQTPVNLVNGQKYLVMVGHDAGNEGEMRIARDGDAIINSSLVYYPESNGLYYLLKIPMIRMHIFPVASTPGCMNATADNYNPSATVNDDSCIFSGCTDPVACNYDPVANWDDASCCYQNCVQLTVTGGSNPAQISWSFTDDNGSVIATGGANNSSFFCLPADCYVFNLFDAAGNGWNGATFTFQSLTGTIWKTGTLANGSSASINIPIVVVPGCTNPGACNYLPAATCEDGSCIFPGCINPAACNYDATKGCDDGSCIFPGCINPAACNYDATKGCDDGSCIFPGCIDHLACNYDPTKGCDDGSCIYPGCIDPAACNYDATKGCDDGSCVYPGCINPAACNYDPVKGCDDGSCIFPGCINPAACNFDPTKGCDDGSCVFPGCINPLACNYDPTKGCDNGSCVFPGCINPLACNYDPTKGCDNGSCIFPGCTNPLACNYDPTKGCDDGSCVFPGCTDPTANNYNPAAGCDDGSCIFCPTDITNDGITNVGDLLVFLPDFGCSGNCGASDMNGDGAVNTGDLLLFLANFGMICD